MIFRHVSRSDISAADVESDQPPDTCELCDATIDWESITAEPDVGLAGGWSGACTKCGTVYTASESGDILELVPTYEAKLHYVGELRRFVDQLEADVKVLKAAWPPTLIPLDDREQLQKKLAAMVSDYHAERTAWVARNQERKANARKGGAA
jgi:hypothetical protein